MADRGPHPRHPTHGLVSLPQVLLGGAAFLLVGAAVVFLGSGPVIPSFEVLPGAQAAGEPVTTASGPEAEEAGDDLRINVRGPARLVPGRPAPLEVRMGDAATALGTGPQRVLLTFDLELRREARGWVLTDPHRLLTSAADLPGETITITGLSGIPCGTAPGTLTVTARELALDGRSGQATYEIPEVACPGDDVPEAPDSLHLQQRVWDSGNGDWRAQVARLLAPAPSPTTSAASAPARTPSRSAAGSPSGPAEGDDGSDEDQQDDRDPSEETVDTDEENPEPRGSDAEAREPAGETDPAPEEAADESGAWEPAPDDEEAGTGGADAEGATGDGEGSEED